jgi:hypothetical protein
LLLQKDIKRRLAVATPTGLRLEYSDSDVVAPIVAVSVTLGVFPCAALLA